MEYLVITDGGMGDASQVATLSDVMSSAAHTCSSQLRRQGTSLMVFTYTNVPPDEERTVEEIFRTAGEKAVQTYLDLKQKVKVKKDLNQKIGPEPED